MRLLNMNCLTFETVDEIDSHFQLYYRGLRGLQGVEIQLPKVPNEMESGNGQIAQLLRTETEVCVCVIERDRSSRAFPHF